MPDLADIPGMSALRSHTHGDPRIKIAVLDGKVDLDRACFQGGNLTRIEPYWAEPFDIDPADMQAFVEIDLRAKAEGLSEEESKVLMEAAIPDENIRNSIHLQSHAAHIISTICGQLNSPVEGIAPNVTVINIPIALNGEDFINPLNLSRAISTAIEQGVNIIHCAACHPTQSGIAHEFIDKAIKQAQENNILVIAPGGNDKGECWCIPAVLDNVLTVGAMKDTGEPFKFSNFGGKYASQGILAPGENILGALPGTDIPIRQKGTSCAAPIVTGTAALLMSLQLEQGLAPDADAVRAALTNSAIPCDRETTEEPERCLLGKINIAGAYELITGEVLSPVVQSVVGDANQRDKTRDYYNSTNETIVKDWGTTYQAAVLVTDEDISLEERVRRSTLHFADRAGIEPGDYVLDAGCGAGGPAVTICQHIPSVRIEGITLSEEQAKTANQLIKKSGLEERIKIQIGDFHDLLFASNIFDVIYFFESLEHADDLPKVFAQAYRVLRPGGILYLKAGFEAEPPLTQEQEKDIAIVNEIYAMNLVPMSRMVEAVKQAGFENVEANDISDIIDDSAFFEKAFFDEKSGELTDYGKKHRYEFKDLKMTRGEIKATKPVDLPVILPNIRSSKPQSATQALTISSSATLGAQMPASRIVSTPISGTVASVSSPIAATESPAITPSAATSSPRSNLVYALGTIGYDFGTEARRDTFKQFMPAISIGSTQVPANPYDARQMADYLEANLFEAKSLIWTINLELTPVYAIKPVGAFGADIYEMLTYMLAGQVLAEDDADYIERVSIPGIVTDEMVRLFSGQEVPILKVNSPRGMYGWKVNSLVESALQTVGVEQEIADENRMRRSLTSFLNRVYYDLRNLGQLARDRALNFAATNAFQAVQTFSDAVAQGMELADIEVEKSPFCRYGSECWDVKLKFFDPDNGRRAKRVFRFTIDVSDRTPVTLGKVRSWAVSK
ncbi:MAG: PatA/PatG family cyanobactin maturation protease [Geitlerinemataceae cyanobacterium]